MNRKRKVDGQWTTDLKFIHEYSRNNNLMIENRPKSKAGPQLVHKNNKDDSFVNK